MLRLFSVQLLAVWLLLSHVSGKVPPGWLDEVIKLCGRELVRARIEICGKVSLGARALAQEEQRTLGSGPSTGKSCVHCLPSLTGPLFPLVASGCLPTNQKRDSCSRHKAPHPKSTGYSFLQVRYVCTRLKPKKGLILLGALLGRWEKLSRPDSCCGSYYVKFRKGKVNH